MESAKLKLEEKYDRDIFDLMAFNGGNLPEYLFRFSQKFNISRKLSPAFTGDLIREGIFRSTISKLLKLSDYWFTFETLGIYLVKSRGYILRDSKIIRESNFFNDLYYDDLKEILNSSIIKRLREHTRWKDQICVLIDVLVEDECIKLNLKNKIKRFKQLLEEEKPIDISLFLSVIYAIRNVYVHSGGTLFGQVKSYNFLNDFFEYLICSQEIIIYFIINKELEKMIKDQM